MIGIEVPEWGCLMKHVHCPALLLKALSQLKISDASVCVSGCVFVCVCEFVLVKDMSGSNCYMVETGWYI